MLPDDSDEQEKFHRLIAMLPLLAVPFLLWLWFLYSTWLYGIERPMAFHASIASSSTALSTDLPRIIISGDETVEFDTQTFASADTDLFTLSQLLRELAPRTGPKNQLLVQPDPDVRHQRLIEVLSAIHRAGIRNYCLL